MLRFFTVPFTHTICIFLLLHSVPGVGQTNNSLSAFKADVEAGGYVSDDKAAPFWLRTNQFGIVPTQFPAAIVQGSVRRDYVFYDSLHAKPRKWDWGFAVNPVGVFDKTDHSRLLFPEVYAKTRFRRLEFSIGRRKEVMGLGDTTLSSGFYSVSGNSLPIPKVQLSTVGFVPLRFTGNFVAINAGFAHGWYATDYIDGIRLHQKYLYIRLGKPASGGRFYFGLNHNVMWAGHSEYLKQHPELALNGELPSSWKFYPNVIFAFTSKNWFTKNGYGAFDSYRLGNHLGSYDFGFDTKIGENKLWIYHQHPFEDVSSMIFKNLPDGLYGINYKMTGKKSSKGFMLRHITLEFLTTKDQSGSTFYIPGSKFQGADNYFNHSQYYEGWSYMGRTVGTPFIAPGKDMDKVYGRYFPSNRVNMWYAGGMGQVGSQLFLTLRASYSRNFGIPGTELVPVRGQFSSVLSGEYALRGNVRLLAKVAVDKGTLFVNSTGGFFGVRKSW